MTATAGPLKKRAYFNQRDALSFPLVAPLPTQFPSVFISLAPWYHNYLFSDCQVTAPSSFVCTLAAYRRVQV